MLWSPGLQLLHPFENQANDYSGNARHGTLGGSPPCTYATRPNAGRCLYFPGTGYVATPSFGLSGTVAVFAADMRIPSAAATAHTLLSDGAQSNTVGYFWCYRITGENHLYWSYATGTSTVEAYCDNYFLSYSDVWLHLMVACDYAGKAIYVYRNGVLFGSPLAMSGTPPFPSTSRAKYLGCYNPSAHFLTAGYLQNVYLGTLATCPPVPVLTANANRLMLSMNPIW